MEFGWRLIKHLSHCVGLYCGTSVCLRLWLQPCWEAASTDQLHAGKCSPVSGQLVPVCSQKHFCVFHDSLQLI